MAQFQNLAIAVYIGCYFFKVALSREQLCGTKALFPPSISDVSAVLSRDALPFTPGLNMHFRVCLHDNNVQKTKMFSMYFWKLPIHMDPWKCL